jgi:hypothetical protein
MRYLPPGQPVPPPPVPNANTYLTPAAVVQQTSAPASPTLTPPPPALPLVPARDEELHRGTLFDEWRVRHGSDWVRADDLDPTVRRRIDEHERLPAIRQRLRQLVRTPLGGLRLESKVVGNAARPVAFYRVVDSDTA